MVTEYGMSDALGPMRFGQPQGEVFLGRDFGTTPDYSDEVAASIDGEVRRLIESAHDVAREILEIEPRRARPSGRRADRARDARGRARAGVFTDVRSWDGIASDGAGRGPAAAATDNQPSPRPRGPE